MKFRKGDKVMCKIHLPHRYLERGGEIVEVDEEKQLYKVGFNNKMISPAMVEEKDITVDIQPNREKRLQEILKEENKEILDSWGYDERD
ncbi:MAG: hypothetical protein SLAVMIC_00993 [uncultured marine phage]|uniref:Uncharacterized protein n=1 Tax=uncultured marine phage TaxID=707152 RepID=A0A8D9CB00_9VIRU|nr:MAG: hypothetical protein SLAVMIC_00993 [uncultured marine phage]